MRRWLALMTVLTVASGCTKGSLNGLRTDLSSRQVSADLTGQPSALEERAMIAVLRSAIDTTAEPPIFRSVPVPQQTDIKQYLAAGFGLTDLYCDTFFRQTNRAYRLRKFGRSLTNDVGTAIQAVVGLAGGAKDVVTGLGTAFGVADSGWRNYDDAFIVAPELDDVRALVLAAQDELRSETYKSEKLPTDYLTARSVITRYAGLCSFLGMQALLKASVKQQTDLLKKKAEPPVAGADTETVSTASTVEPARTARGRRRGAARSPTVASPSATPSAPASVEPSATAGAIPR